MRIPGIKLRNEYLEPSFVAQEVAKRKSWLISHGQFFLLPAALTESTIFWILAALESKSVIVPIHPESSAEEILRFKDVLGDVVVISEAQLAAGGCAPFTRKDTQGLSAILFSSGSTGLPKAIAITEKNLIASAQAHSRKHELGPTDSWLLSLPLFHVGGFSVISRAYFLDQDIAFSPSLDTDEALFWLSSGLVAGISMVPTQLWRLLEKDPTPACQTRIILLGGAAIPAATIHRALQASLPIKVSYGLTESCSQVFSGAPLIDSAPQYAGTATPGLDFKVASNGEICLRGDMLSPGYWNNGRITSNRDSDGFFRTGDLVTLAKDGGLNVLGREDDLIISGGENLFPAEIESALLEILWVADAAVVGLPSEEWGKTAAALIVPRDILPPDAEEEIKKQLREKLNPWKIPKKFLFGKIVPRNAMKKIIRQEVLKLFLS